MILYDRNDVPHRLYRKDPTRIRELQAKGWTKEPRRKHAAKLPVKTEVAPEAIKIDLNTASVAELKIIPKVGVATAQKLIDARPIEDFGVLVDVAPDVSWLDLSYEGKPIKVVF